MTLTIHRAAERFRTELGWLDSRHTFSFGGHHDPRRMGFRALRVINDDRVEAGAGFPTHGHRDMEIVSYVVEGALAHRDSLGNGSVIEPGDVQRMSAGRGVMHSEMNARPDGPTRFLQIWIVPSERALAPSYAQERFPESERRGRLRLVMSEGGREGSVRVHRDVDLYATLLAPGERVTHAIARDRHVWAQVVRGAVELAGQTLREGDAASISDASSLEVAALDDAELLVFDLA